MAFEPVPFYFTDQGVGSLHDGAGLSVNSECRRGHYCWRGALLRQWLLGGRGYINIDCVWLECAIIHSVIDLSNMNNILI